MSLCVPFHVSGTGSASSAVLQTNNIILLLLCAVLAISLIVIAFLICAIKENKCDYCNDKGIRSYLTISHLI